MRILNPRQSCFLFTLFLFAVSNVYSQELLGKCTQGEVTGRGEKIELVYMGNNNLPYGAAASARPGQVNMIVYHYPYGSCDPIQSVSFGHTFDTSRRGFFGYHFYIAQDGRVLQGAPMFKRTNHTDPGSSRGVVAYNNNTSIGITLVCGEKGPSEQQVMAAVKVGQALQIAYGVPNNRVFGHGEIQRSRGVGEGAPAQQRVRAGTPVSEYILSYTTASGVVSCIVNGAVPPGCANNTCGYNFPVTPNAGGVPFNGNVHDPRSINAAAVENDLPLLQKNYPQHLPDELKNKDEKKGLNFPKPTTLNPADSLKNKSQNDGRKGNPALTNLFTSDCLSGILSEKRARVIYYNNQYQKSFKSKYGDWDKVESSTVNVSQKLSLDFVLAVFYSRQIRTNLEYLKKCSGVVNFK